jgi:hypothetical protein
MATFSIATDINYNNLSAMGAISGSDTYNITNGARLTIDTDTRWCRNRTVSAGNLGNVNVTFGEFYIDGTSVRIIPYNGAVGSGTVPIVGTNIGQGSSVSAYFLAIFPSLSSTPLVSGTSISAAPTGYIKVKNVTGGSFAAGALSNIGASATGPDVVGWIELVGAETLSITVAKLGNFKVRGAWYDAGQTNGVAGQSVQLPAPLANTYYPGVWISTTPAATEYEYFPNNGTTTTTSAVRTDVAGKVVWISSQGVVRIGKVGGVATGFLPASGCNIRIPNIITSNVVGTAPGLNTLPNATLATRYDFTSTGAGNIDIDKMNLAWYPSFTQAYTIAIKNTSICESLLIAECASPILLSNVGVGQTTANTQVALALSLCPTGGTISACTWSKAAAAAAYVVTITDTSNLNVYNDKSIICTTRSNAGAVNHLLTRTTYSNFYNTSAIGARIGFTTCDNIFYSATSYVDNISGPTVTAVGNYSFVIDSNSTNIKIDGLDFFGLADSQPFAGIYYIGVGNNNVKIRNFGSPTNVLNLGNATSGTANIILGTAGGASKNIELNRIYCSATRTGNFVTWDNSYNYVTIANVWSDDADTLTPINNNAIFKGVKSSNTITGQTSVYGTHWFDIFTSQITGRVGIIANEKTTVAISDSSYSLDVAGTGCAFDSTGKIIMPNVGDQITWTTPYYILGHRRFETSALPTRTVTNPYNFQMYYDIDKGTGFSNTYDNFTYNRIGRPISGTYVVEVSGTGTSAIKIGDYIYGASISANSIVTRIDSTQQIRISRPTTATSASSDMSFCRLPTIGHVRLTLTSGSYTSAVLGDLGRTVIYSAVGTPGHYGTLIGYDNIDRNWFVQVSAGSTFSAVSAVLVSAGTGVGILTSAGLVDTPIDISAGFKLKVRSVVERAAATNAITYITADTRMQYADQQNALYPMDVTTAQLYLYGLTSGTEVRVYRTSDNYPLTGVESTSGATSATFTYNYTWEGADINVYIVVFAIGYQPIRYENQTLGRLGLTIPVQETIDRVYNNPNP